MKQFSRATAFFGLLLVMTIAVFARADRTMAAFNMWTGGGTTNNCSDGANWSLGVAPTSSDDVVINTGNKAITWDASCPSTVNSFLMDNGYTGTGTLTGNLTTTTTLTINSGSLVTAKDIASNITVGTDFTVGRGATVVIRRSKTTGNGSGQIITAANLTVASGATLNADTQGFDDVAGPGHGVYGSAACTVGGGGSHGGVGGCIGAAGSKYGSATAPTALGSGGGDNSPGYGASHGGGAIKLLVSGNVIVNGRLSANGQASANVVYGGGAGGSIWIAGGSLSGAGTIAAKGGNGGTTTNGAGGGGGGRIDIAGTTNTFVGIFDVAGGALTSPGHAGTIAFPASQLANFTLTKNLTLGSDIAYAFGTLTIASGATLTIDSDPTAGVSGSGGTIAATNMTIGTGGSLSVDGLGFPTAGLTGQGGPGAGGYNSGGSGGGHGGRGGATTAAAGGTYDSLTSPRALGSAGGENGSFEATSGGGALTLTVTNTLAVYGTLSANGNAGSFPTGGGAGGSLNITAGAAAGNGIIRANGGGADPSLGGAGAGGRIAVKLTSGTSFGALSIQAFGGGTGTSHGAAGTVYLQKATDGSGKGQLIIDNNGTTTAAGTDTRINAAVTGTSVGAVILRKAGTLRLGTGGVVLNVAGNWTDSVGVSLGSGTIILNGTNQTLSGATTFYNLQKTVSSADTLTFNHTKTVTVLSGTTLQGANSNLLSLRSDVPSQQFSINVSSTYRLIKFLDVKDSHNTNASSIISPLSVDSGNNTNWTITSGDTTPPTVSITTPASGSSVSGSTLPVSATASDNNAVAGVQFKVDGTNIGAEDTTAPYGIVLDTTAVVDGAHTLQAVARDPAGNTATGSVTVTVDNTPPIISAITSTGATNSSATITWTTNEASTSQVEYGTTTSYGSSTTLSGALVTSHHAQITGLSASTTYHYRVRSKDAAGNLTISTDSTFTTTNDTTPPVLSAITATGTLDTSISIHWATDESADSQVDYGLTASYGSSSTLNTSLLTNHSVSLSGLTASTTYHYRVKSKDAASNLATSTDHTFTTAVDLSQPRIFLTPSVLASLRQKATSNTAQWQAFKANLDAYLPLVPAYQDAAYQGSELPWISNYALGYKILEDSDPTTAQKYADKAIGLMKSGLNDFQKGDEVAYQYLARGDGTTKTFTLPNFPNPTSSFKAYLGAVQTVPITKGAADGTDDAALYYGQFIKVSNTSDGTADYSQGTDWIDNPNLTNNISSIIDWSPAGAEPTTGATYYATWADRIGASTASAYTLSGTTLTFTTAPPTSQAIFVQYLYGTHANDYSTLAYQQTSAGDGGFNSILIDTGYTSRYLGKHVAMGYDWLYDYPGFSSALKTQAANTLYRWSTYIRDHGYHAGTPESNYEAGAYDSRMMTALALSGQRTAAGSGNALVTEIGQYRTTTLLPRLQTSTGALFGGYWSEGWNYGSLATENLLLAGLAYEAAGNGTVTPERTWAQSVIKNFLINQPTETTLYDGGDWYASPAPFPGKPLFYALSAAASGSTAAQYANHVIQNYAGSQSNDFMDLLFRDPNASATSWTSTLPLTDFAKGTGLVTARASWDYLSTWWTFLLGNLTGADHQQYSPGQLQIQRGADNLLVNAASVSELQVLQKSTYGNLVLLDDNGDGVQTYRDSMGVWYGTPGVVMNDYEASGSYVYSGGDYKAAYSLNSNPGDNGSASRLTRQVVYLRPDLIIVHDRVATKKASYPKLLQWHFLNPPTVSGSTWIEANGSSKLFGATFSSVALTTTLSGAVKVGDTNTTVARIRTTFAATTQTGSFLTVLESAPSSSGSMVASQRIASTDGMMEGVQAGNAVVMFASTGALTSTGSFSYVVSGSAPLSHIVTDLMPDRSYRIVADGNQIATKTSSSDGVIAFDSVPSGSQTITVAAGNASTTTLTSSLNPSAYGSGVTLTASVSPSSATGTITFKDGSTTLTTITLSHGSGSFITSSLSVGSHSLTAVYGGNGTYPSSTSPVLTQVVNGSASTTTLASNFNPSTFGSGVTLTGTVSPSSATGTVTFKDGSTTLGTATLGHGSGSYATSSLSAGSHSIAAVYGGNTSYNGSTSPTLTQTVNKANTATMLISTLNPSTFGSGITLTATVSPSSATGTITFKDGAATIGNAPIGHGSGSIATSALAGGTHSLTAVYSGDSDFSASTSTALTQSVTKATTSTIVSSNINPSSSGQLITLTAAVTPMSATGSITFKDGITTLGTATLGHGSGSYATSSLAVGTHGITANYGGNTDYLTSTSTAISQRIAAVLTPTTTTLASDLNPSTIGSGVLLTATVSPSSATGTLTFKDGTTALGTVTVGHGSGGYTTSALAIGSHSLTAVFSGSGNYAGSTSAGLTQTVNGLPTTTTLASSATSITQGASITLTATVSPLTATGTVTFKDGSTTLGTATLSNGSGSYSTSALGAGSHSLTAVYGGNQTYASSTSATVTEVVSAPATAGGGGGGSSGGGGGGGGGSRGLSILPLTLTTQTGSTAVSTPTTSANPSLSVTVNQTTISFRDVPTSSWFAPFIAELIQKGIVSGYADKLGHPLGIFGPGNPVTYAEVAKMAILGAGLSPSTDTPKNRSAQNQWSASYIAKAEELALSPYTSSINVNQPISRAEALEAILEAFQIPMTVSTSVYTDVSAKTPYAQAILTATSLGIVQGDTGPDGKPTGTFRPDDTINRAEAAKILTNVLAYAAGK
jgi:hypothetical protein